MRNEEEILEELIVQQRTKLLNLANRINPRLTADDISQPHDWPELTKDAQFQYEDGILAGLLSAQLSLRAYKKKGQA